MKHLLLATIVAVLLVGAAFAEPIHDAVENGDLAGVQAELDKGADVNAATPYPPLLIAADNGHKEIVELLIAAGADLNATAQYGGRLVENDSTPLHKALHNGHKEIAELLITAGANVNLIEWEIGYTPLHIAADSGYKEIVELLIAAGADLNARTQHWDVTFGGSYTPLCLALYKGHKEIAELLIAAGANVNAGGEMSPLHIARDKEMVELLIANGADVKSSKHFLGDTPLHIAAVSGRKEIVQLLLAEGADVNAKSLNDETPLSAAIRGNHKEVAEFLITEGADVNATMGFMSHLPGFTLLHYAASWGGNKEIAELLLANGADVNATSDKGTTPLDWAIRYKRTETADLLRKHGGRTEKEIAEGVPYLYLFYSKDQFSIYGEIGLKFEVHYSSDVKEWQVLDTVTLEASPQVYIDGSGAEQPMRFYQLRLVE